MRRRSAPLSALMRGLALLAGLIGLAGAGVSLGGAVDPWLDLASHFAPLWLALAVICLTAGLLGGRSRLGPWLLATGALGAAVSLALIVPEYTRPLSPAADGAQGRRLRLIAFNAWADNARPAAAAAWIAAQRPDVVAIEEDTPRLRAELQARGFAFVQGMSTTALFTRLPRAGRAFTIPPAVWPTLPEFARGRFRLPDTEGTFDVVAVHLTWPTMWMWWSHRETFAKLIDRFPHQRLIVTGDFNLTPWSFALRTIDRRFGLERRDRAIPTWPALRDFRGRRINLPAVLPIDHVWAGPAWRTIAVRRGPRLGSDHYPLIIDLALEPGR